MPGKKAGDCSATKISAQPASMVSNQWRDSPVGSCPQGALLSWWGLVMIPVIRCENSGWSVTRPGFEIVWTQWRQ